MGEDFEVDDICWRGENKGTCSDISSGPGSKTVLVLHEDSCVDDVSRGGEVGVVEVDSGLDSRTMFVHEDASDVVGSREGVIGVIEGVVSGSGTVSMHEVSGEGTGSVVEAIELGDSWSDLGTRSVHEGEACLDGSGCSSVSEGANAC